MTAEEHKESIETLVSKTDTMLDTYDEAIKNARSEHTQRILNDRKNIIARGLEIELAELDSELGIKTEDV